MVLCLTRDEETDFLNSSEMVNVALSRARLHLHVIGNKVATIAMLSYSFLAASYSQLYFVMSSVCVFYS